MTTKSVKIKTTGTLVCDTSDVKEENIVEYTFDFVDSSIPNTADIKVVKEINTYSTFIKAELNLTNLEFSNISVDAYMNDKPDRSDILHGSIEVEFNLICDTEVDKEAYKYAAEALLFWLTEDAKVNINLYSVEYGSSQGDEQYYSEDVELYVHYNEESAKITILSDNENEELAEENLTLFSESNELNIRKVTLLDNKAVSTLNRFWSNV